MSGIVLAACNASYSHPSFGLRCLRANLGELRERTGILEFDRRCGVAAAADRILAGGPGLVGLGVYIWNADWIAALARELKARRPGLPLVLGGPEISHETDRQDVAGLADCVVCGEADVAFAEVARVFLAGGRPPARVLRPAPPDPAALAPVAAEYSDADLAHRIVYVETARGCPYGCEYCLSSLDRRLRPRPLEPVFAELADLLARGARRLKFVDRTFNADPARAGAILGFLRPRARPGLSLHFELVPGRLPAGLRAQIAGYPAGVLRFEVGIQTWDEEVAARVGRVQRAAEADDALAFLCRSGAVVHADLIAGLPGETPESFARGFDRLLAHGPAEIQVGVLKRLRGTAIGRHDAEWGMRWAASPPFEVLETAAWPRAAMDRLKRFARYWELLGNRGRFPRALPLLWSGGGSPFAAFMSLSDRMFEGLGATHALPLEDLARALLDHLAGPAGVDRARARAAVAADYAASGLRRLPRGLRG